MLACLPKAGSAPDAVQTLTPSKRRRSVGSRTRVGSTSNGAILRVES